MQGDLITVTGAGGYIARHIVLQLLNSGYRVRGTIRSQARAAEILESLRAHLKEPSDLEKRLTFSLLDLNSDAGWDDAMAGASALLHTASPFPFGDPKNPDELIRPAVEGTRRALRSARDAGVERVVLTSSIAAVSYGNLPVEKPIFDESDWTDPDDPRVTPYIRSKTLAERAAWAFVENEAPELRLTAINPGFVVGPALGNDYGTSLQVIERILAAKDPAMPDIHFPIVDVRDVATAHVRALETPSSEGKRILVIADTISFVDIAKAVKAAAPGRRIVTRQAPDWLIRLVGLFDRGVASIVPQLGRRRVLSNARARDVLGMTFIEPKESVAASTRYLIEREKR